MLKISELFSKNKKTLFLIIMGIGLFLSFVPSHFAYAAIDCEGCSWTNPIKCFICLIEYIASLPFRLPFLILVLVIGLIALVCALFLGLATALLAWAVEMLMSVPITHAGVVTAGWTFSRDFANMFFILALVFIGLSTILRIREYEAKKALPILIIIAVLINFTPVIVGFIVDMSNIVTDFFLQDVGGLANIGEKTSAAANYLKDAVINTATINGDFFTHLLPYEGEGGETNPGILADFTGLMIYGLVLIAYFLLAALIYLLIVCVFFFRIIVLWVLTILAPIAFLSKIFPATKETKMVFPSILHWDEWWEKLIQWSIVGIPIGFFLYLSNYVLTVMDVNSLFGANTLNTQLTEQGLTGAFATMILAILSPIVALVLLIWGAMISLQAAPAGAQGIVNWAKKGALGAAKFGGRFAGTALGRRISPSLERWGQRLTARGLIPAEAPKGVKGVFAKAIGLTGIPKISRFGARQLGRGIEIGGREIRERIATQDDKEVGDAEKKAAKRNSADNINDLRKAFYRRDMNGALGYLKGTINNGDTNDIIDAIGSRKLNWKDISRLYQTAEIRGTPHRRLVEKAFLPWILDKKDEQGNVKERNILGVSAANQEKIFDKIKSSDIADEIIDPRSIDPNDPTLSEEGRERAERALDAMLLKGDSQLVPQLLRTKKKHRDSIWQYIQSKNPEWFVDNNREDILRWSTSTAARGLGLGSIGGLDTGQAENLISQRRLASQTEEQLKEKKASLEVGLNQMTQGKQRNAVQRQINQIGDELNLRDETQNPTSTLSQEKATLETQIEELKAKSPEEMTPDDYKNKATAEKRLGVISRELKRRGGLEVPSAPEEEPSSVQIAALKEKETELEKQMPNLYGLARKNAGEELKQITSQRKQLEQQFGKKSPVQRFIENSILEEQKEISKKAKEAVEIEATIKNLREKETQVNNDIEASRGRPGVSPEQTSELEHSLSGIRNQIATYEKERTGRIEEVNSGREHLDHQKNVWRELTRPMPEMKTAEELLRGNLDEALQREKEARTQLFKLKNQRVGPNEIAAAEKNFAKAKGAREGWEGTLGAQLRLGELESRKNTINERLQTQKTQMAQWKEITKGLDAQIAGTNRELESINKGLTYQKTRLKDILTERDKLLTTVQEEILRTTPGWTTVPQKVLKERERIDPRFAPLDVEMKAIQNTTDTLERNLRRKESTFKKLGERNKEAAKRYNALIMGGETARRKMERVENEMGRIERGEITPKLSKKKRV